MLLLLLLLTGWATLASSLEDKTAGPGDADEEDDGGGDGGEVSSSGSVKVFSSSPDDWRVSL